MNTYTTHFESWLNQLYYYLITSVLVDDALQSYHDFDKEYLWDYYEMGLTARDAVKVFIGRLG